MLGKRILVLTPWVPYPVTGACQQDRFNGFKQMQAMGHEVHVIAKIHPWQPRAEAESVFAVEGISLTLIPYVKNHWQLLFSRLPQIIREPALIDGAALEYTDPAYEALVKDAIERFKPDLIWIEYTLLWPVLRLIKPYGIPTIMKSSLNEPANCRDENGWSLTSIIKSLPKYSGETIAATESDFIFGITPVEEEWYRSRGAKHTGTLPLRGLSRCLTRKTHHHKDVLDVVFLSSNYNMGHNRDALLYLLQEILPRVRSRAPGKFRFHLTGSKFRRSSAICSGPMQRPLDLCPTSVHSLQVWTSRSARGFPVMVCSRKSLSRCAGACRLSPQRPRATRSNLAKKCSLRIIQMNMWTTSLS